MIRNKCLLHAKHAQHDPRVGKIVSSEDKLTGLNRRNIIAAPVFDSENNVIAVIEVPNKLSSDGEGNDNDFDKADEKIISLICR